MRNIYKNTRGPNGNWNMEFLHHLAVVTIKSKSGTLNQAAHDFGHTRTHVKMLREERRELLSNELWAISVA